MQRFKTATSYAFFLLKFRPRTVKELGERLKKKGFPPEDVDSALSLLKEKKFIDDKDFADRWIKARVKRSFGIIRIKRELLAKGIEPGFVQEATERLKDEYPQERAALELAREKAKKLKKTEKAKAVQRCYAYLLRRGFSAFVSMEAVKRALKE